MIHLLLWMCGGIGASSGDIPNFDTWRLSLSGNSPNVWTELNDGSGIAPSGRNGHSLVLTNNDTLLVFGGMTNAANAYLNELWEFNLTTSTWRQISFSSGPEARVGHVAAFVGGCIQGERGYITSSASLNISLVNK